MKAKNVAKGAAVAAHLAINVATGKPTPVPTPSQWATNQNHRAQAAVQSTSRPNPPASSGQKR